MRQVNEADSGESIEDFVCALLTVDVTPVQERREIDHWNGDFFRVQIFPVRGSRHALHEYQMTREVASA